MQDKNQAKPLKDPMLIALRWIKITSVALVALILVILFVKNLWIRIACAIVAVAILGFLYVAARGCLGPLVPVAMWGYGRQFRKNYGKRPAGEIVFYGASNFTLWKTLEEDMAPYHAQNHGFGGSNDKLLMAQAEKFLYPYKPSVVFLQTGSNDNVGGLTLEQIMENKKKMYATFHEHLPDAKFVVMSGLPLPGRPMHWENINKLNQFLEDYCSKLDYLEFINATPFMMKDGNFRPEYYVKDGVHLNADGHEQWTAAMKKKLEEMGIKP